MTGSAIVSVDKSEPVILALSRTDDGSLYPEVTVINHCDVGYPQPLGVDHSTADFEVDASGNYAYLTFSTQQIENGKRVGYIRKYSVDRTLDPVFLLGTSQIKAGQTPASIAFDPLGKYLFAIDDTGNQLLSYKIDPTTGDLAAMQAFTTGKGPRGIVADPLERAVYVANSADNTISVFRLNADTGSLTPAGNAVSAKQPYNLAVDPSGKYLYATNNGADQISIYQIADKDGNLSLVSAGVADGGKSPDSIVIDHSGKYLYVSGASSAIKKYEINSQNGMLENSVDITSIVGIPASIALDQTGKMLLISVKPKDSTRDKATAGFGVITSLNTPGQTEYDCSLKGYDPNSGYYPSRLSVR
jgi:6-phosphogluconolactonase (cycloisomerase 2 family)